MSCLNCQNLTSGILCYILSALECLPIRVQPLVNSAHGVKRRVSLNFVTQDTSLVKLLSLMSVAGCNTCIFVETIQFKIYRRKWRSYEFSKGYELK
jgi:hypothetical protein